MFMTRKDPILQEEDTVCFLVVSLAACGITTTGRDAQGRLTVVLNGVDGGKAVHAERLRSIFRHAAMRKNHSDEERRRLKTLEGLMKHWDPSWTPITAF